MSKGTDVSRRKFLKGTGLAAGTAAFALAMGGCKASPTVNRTDNQTNITDNQSSAAQDDSQTELAHKAVRGMMFFTNSLQFNTIADAAERIYPKDDTGPGAKELGVPFFIDNQLASGWGYNAREYIGGPHFAGASTQGYQGTLNRRDVFLQGVEVLNKEANSAHGSDFPDLTDAQKDSVLKKCEAGELEMAGLTSAEFFSFLRSAVIAGVYADPIYNGNNNMDGWRMKDYPGAQMSYFWVITNDKFETMEPVSLADMIQDH